MTAAAAISAGLARAALRKKVVYVDEEPIGEASTLFCVCALLRNRGLGYLTREIDQHVVEDRHAFRVTRAKLVTPRPLIELGGSA